MCSSVIQNKGKIYLRPFCQLIQHIEDIFFPGTNSSF